MWERDGYTQHTNHAQLAQRARDRERLAETEGEETELTGTGRELMRAQAWALQVLQVAGMPAALDVVWLYPWGILVCRPAVCTPYAAGLVTGEMRCAMLRCCQDGDVAAQRRGWRRRMYVRAVCLLARLTCRPCMSVVEQSMIARRRG